MSYSHYLGLLATLPLPLSLPNFGMIGAVLLGVPPVNLSSAGAQPTPVHLFHPPVIVTSPLPLRIARYANDKGHVTNRAS